MTVDIRTEIEIARPRAVVAEYAANPDNAMSWYANITSVEWRSPRPLSVGSRIEFVMGTAEGPFPMETTYTWSDSPSGGTLMTLRNQGEPAGFAKVATPMMAKSMERANRKDLAMLKATVEAQS
jgi:hypothetical protein